MESLPKQMLLKIINDSGVKLEDLPKEVLIHMINDLQSKVTKLKDLQGANAQYVEVDDDLTDQLKSKCEELEKENESLRSKLNFKQIANDSSDEELEESHKFIFDNFIAECCKWSAKRMKSKCTDTNRYYEIAAGSTELLYKTFKDWAVASDLIIGKGKSNVIPSKEKFKRLCVEGHKNRFPNDWCQKPLKFPLSPNGSFNTPRVNLHLVKDPVTKEEIYKGNMRYNIAE